MGVRLFVFVQLRTRKSHETRPGSIKPVIDKVVPLAEAAQAYAAMEAGGTVGKVVIRIA